MPKLVNEGNRAPLGKPPASLKFKCTACGAELETTDDEPTAKATVFEPDRPVPRPGWNIECPHCHSMAFVDSPGRQ